MNYLLDKYRFIQNGNRVIALSTYAGRTVRGTAVCSPEDSFSLDKGKKLAAARCALKIANKRLARAESKVTEATLAADMASEYYDNMINYRDDAVSSYYDAEDHLRDLLESM